ncbi:putative protein FAR1-RELATED SEQUENCE 12 [Iris pallida]|uniref:Uncharacterized protein n=1 Tax=Iris pallida TaxID=29817 RepID=A0AAX6ERG4_IRIPA|nr:putative protein FAR1-RELATED SEQUENCE 12 [Iris pallida]
MELKKKQRKKSSSNPQEQQGGGAADARTGELSRVKAAAWAWYQHGSGCSHSKPIDDSLTRTRTRRGPDDPRPSRHRLETLSPPGSLLLDLYEIEQITKELNRLIVSCRRDPRRPARRLRPVCRPRNAATTTGGRRRRRGRLVGWHGSDCAGRALPTWSRRRRWPTAGGGSDVEVAMVSWLCVRL